MFLQPSFYCCVVEALPAKIYFPVGSSLCSIATLNWKYLRHEDTSVECWNHSHKRGSAGKKTDSSRAAGTTAEAAELC